MPGGYRTTEEFYDKLFAKTPAEQAEALQQLKAALDKPGPVPAPIARWKPTPPADQALSLQEPGRRQARAFPYQPSVSGLVADGKLMVALGNDGAETAHFAIYPYGGELPAPG